MQIPLDPRIKELADLPYTISYIIRKRQQVDSLNELGKKQRPPESMIWDGTPEEMEDWLENVFEPRGKKDNNFLLDVKRNEIED